ncbi:F-box domain-containing protein [Mycena indigotica]|uniref:F-box domain-containing protein n=1 Tax=Mycena indigotica TaxID=2126181 RepID=A0A8H6SPJ6_9AGAR|nr:F-box domain-containing protein [Mycena indigotica]KAF7301630.1 F-box domain-containing protein [Mycena indigotica]
MLDRLPPEIAESICRWLDAKSVVRLSQVSQRWNDIIKRSSAVQYAIELELSGLCNVDNSSFSPASVARLAALMAYRNSWDRFNPKKHAQVTPAALGGNYWELSCNVFATYDSDRGFTFQRIPCALRNIVPERWDLPVFSGDIADFTMDYSQDLLVVLEVGASMCMVVHLLSMKTGQPHSSARLPRLSRDVEKPTATAFSSFQMRIFGSYVGVMADIGADYTEIELMVWEWRNGSLKKHIYSPALTSFAFLDNERIIISTFLEDDYMKTLVPQLQVLEIAGYMNDMDGSLTLCLPSVDRADVHDVEMLIITEPAPSWPVGTIHEAPFVATHDDRLFVVSLQGFEEGEEDEDDLADPTFLLCIPLSVILGFLRSQYGDPCFLWSDWGPPFTRMIRLLRSPEPWSCFVYGSRCVIQISPDECQMLDFKKVYPLSDNRITHDKKIDQNGRLFVEPVLTSGPFSLRKFPIPASNAVMMTEDSILTVSVSFLSPVLPLNEPIFFFSLTKKDVPYSLSSNSVFLDRELLDVGIGVSRTAHGVPCSLPPSFIISSPLVSSLLLKSPSCAAYFLIPMSPNKRRIAVLGSRSVGQLPRHSPALALAYFGPGKSSLIIQFCQNEFVDSYYPTIESTFAKTVNFKNNEYDCDIIDTAGQDEFSLLNSKHAIGVHGYVLVYSVNSRNSFEMIQIIYDKIISFCGVTSVPCVIVGSKTDLVARFLLSFVLSLLNSSHGRRSRQVAITEGQQLADSNHTAFVETSAKENKNVVKVFEDCLEEIEKRVPNNQAEPPANRCLIM